MRSLLHNFEQKFERRFEHLARDPNMLAMAAVTLNLVANSKIQVEEIEKTFAKFRSRIGSRLESRIISRFGQKQ